MEDPILEMIDALSLEHKIDKVRRQLQWEHITGEGVSEEVLVEWVEHVPVLQNRHSLRMPWSHQKSAHPTEPERMVSCDP
jgi:hypothetical protein